MLATLNTYLKFPIGILGLGRSGQSTANLLKQLGINPQDIKLFDDKEKSGCQNPQQILTSGIKTLVVSPGYPLSHPLILSAKKAGIQITSELSLAALFIKTEKVIALTGSVGKSTTTSLLGEALKESDSLCFVGGNLGTPLADYIAGVLQGQKRSQWVVLELSSYQLENLENIKFEHVAITSLLPNHLERYTDLQDYYLTKLNITRYLQPTGFLFANKNGGDLWSWLPNHFASQQIKWTHPELYQDAFQFSQAKLLGQYNYDNIALTIGLLRQLKLEASGLKALYQFEGLAHRMQNLGQFQSIQFINDSKATTVHSVLEAVNSIIGNITNQLYLLIGGRDKNLDWTLLTSLQKYSNLKIYFFGEVAPHAKSLSHLEGAIYPNLRQLLAELPTHLKAGDTVLLSPGGTSLDEFNSFEHRGDFFKSWVEAQFAAR